MVVCQEGLNSELEALQFTFQELPLWDVTTPSEPTHEPQLIEVDLSSVQPGSGTTAIQTPTTTPVLPPLWPIPLSPPRTLPLQRSTCISGEPWSGCSGLPQSPQPLFPGTILQGDSHHQWPWGLHPHLEEQKIPSGQRGQTPSSLP